MAQIEDFLNSRSMITPGVAGGLVMMITNALGQQFGLQQAWAALVLSFIVGTLVFADKTTGNWRRLLFYVLNSLIIFAMATGTNTTGTALTSGATEVIGFDPGIGAELVQDSGAFFQRWF